MPNKKLHFSIKLLLDVFFSLVGIIFTFPLFIIIPIWIKIESPKCPVLFSQKVVGKNNKEFTLWKFRTMVPHEIDYNLRKDNRSKEGEILLDDERLTRSGRILRRLKFDEIPQLFLVLFGRMSIVGPRPMDKIRFLHSSDFEKQRTAVRPGLTGLAQISGNINLSWEERIQIDIWYIANWSIFLDFRIIFSTPFVIVKGERLNNKHINKRITNSSVRIIKIER